MRILINAVSAKMGGAANYIKSIAQELAGNAGDDSFVFIVPAAQAESLRSYGGPIEVIRSEAGSEPFWRRIWFDQVTLRRIARREKADLLFSTANFAVFFAPCRQILLVRNKLYFSPVYSRMFMRRKSLKARADLVLRRWLNCLSVKAADLVMFPTQSMLDDVRGYVTAPDCKSVVNLYGVDIERFTGNSRKPEERGGEGASEASRAGQPFAENTTLLFPSFYSEHKNFDTLLRALILLGEANVNCDLVTPANPSDELQHWTCTWKQDAALAADPRIQNKIRFTGILNTSQMPQLYHAADIVVYPCAIESFGHPLLEAMAAGAPLVAADVPGNRELCGDAAVYFDSYSAEDLAEKIQGLVRDQPRRQELVQKGKRTVQRFTWARHVTQLVAAFHGEPLSHPASAREFRASATKL